MPKNAVIYTRIDSQLKNDAEDILKQLCVSPSSVIQMLYAQIKLTGRIPFEIGLPTEKLLSKEEISSKIERGLKDVEEGRVYTSEEVDALLKNNKL